MVSPVTNLKRRFAQAYFKKFGERYIQAPGDGGRDGKIFKDLLASLSEQKLLALIDLYFESPGRKSPVFFRSDINDLCVRLRVQMGNQEVLVNNDAERFL